MKKCVICLLCLSIALFCVGCGAYKIEIDGYEKFDINHSDFELNHYLLPDLEFPDKFPYIDIEYHYNEDYKTIEDFTEKSLIVIRYNEKNYEQAKAYCLQNMNLSEAEPIEYSGYVFIENIELAIKQDRYDTREDFPRWFNMLAFNDDENCLVFIGFYAARMTIASYLCGSWQEYSALYDIDGGLSVAQKVRDNWGLFLKDFFSTVPLSPH